MLHRDGYGRHRPIIVRCDGLGCTAFISTPTPDMEEAKRLAHTEKWLVIRKNGIHTQLCPSCREKEEKRGQ